MRRLGWRARAAVTLSTGALLVACSAGAESSGSEGASPAGGGGDPLQEGLDAHAEGDLDRAERLYREAVDVDDGGRPYAHYNLGLVRQTTGRPTEAEEQYRLALAIDPNLASASYNLAILRTQAGAFDEAVELYQRVVTLAPDDAAAHLNLGLLLAQLGRTDEALRELSTAADLDPELARRVASAEPAGATAG